MSHFEVYGELAEQDVEDTCQNGRYAIQGEAESHVPQDVISKLKITESDDFLDIGCGLGLNLKPISQITNSVVGCDHPNVIKKAKTKLNDSHIELIGGDFLSLKFDRKFSKILAYSVLPALPTSEVLYNFIDKALDLLSPSGRMLLGDLSNGDKKKRFISSKRGQEFLKEWDKNYTAQTTKENLSSFSDAGPAVNLTDKFVLEIILYIRNKGYHVYIVDQPQNLPFGNSREDILVVGPEYVDGGY